MALFFDLETPTIKEVINWIEVEDEIETCLSSVLDRVDADDVIE